GGAMRHTADFGGVPLRASIRFNRHTSPRFRGRPCHAVQCVDWTNDGCHTIIQITYWLQRSQMLVYAEFRRDEPSTLSCRARETHGKVDAVAGLSPSEFSVSFAVKLYSS